MKLVEYEDLKRQVEQDYRDNLAALERIWAITQANAGRRHTSSNGATTPPRVPRKPRKGRGPSKSKGDVMKAIKAAIKGLSGNFTVNQVNTALGASEPPVAVKKSTLKMTMKRLANAGEIRIAVQGAGRRATEYQKV